MIQIEGIKKTYEIGKESYEVLKGIDLTINDGEFIAIMGPSGSGKSTLLNLLGGLDQADIGNIQVNHAKLQDMSEKERTLFRRKNIGFVFQNYQLLPNMTVEENIAFPMHADRLPKASIQTTVTNLIQSTKLEGKEKNYPSQLSGGQQQRVSIARALSMEPKLVLADEPTGNLDRKMGTEILRLLSSLHQDQKLTIIMVTHDMYAASFANRIILLKDGMIESDIKQAEGGDQNAMASIITKLNS
ncbi:ABC transporter ATP-binding protein [Cytobacillus kochii]|uniref:ABC transporter ATP-binding protein n=1 Tax=Cytobacillus kochii TaxID=859143 RepID=UPI002E231BA4|nr:ABC transporter ATP-binding protein [Cytobacillus kochii]